MLVIEIASQQENYFIVHNCLYENSEENIVNEKTFDKAIL